MKLFWTLKKYLRTTKNTNEMYSLAFYQKVVIFKQSLHYSCAILIFGRIVFFLKVSLSIFFVFWHLLAVLKNLLEDLIFNEKDMHSLFKDKLRDSFIKIWTQKVNLMNSLTKILIIFFSLLNFLHWSYWYMNNEEKCKGSKIAWNLMCWITFFVLSRKIRFKESN